MRRQTLSYSTVVVLQAVFLGHRYGFDVMDATGLASGTVYPILRRLEFQGMLRSRWEDDGAAQEQQRPARRYYEVSPMGRATLKDGLARYRGIARSFRAPADGETVRAR